MTPSHASKPGRRYRYYITRPDQLEDTPAWRVSAYDLENMVCDRLSILLTDQQFLCELAGAEATDIIQRLLAKADLAAATLRSGSARDKASLLPAILTRIDLKEYGIELTIDKRRLAAAMELETIADTADAPLVLTLPATKVRRGHQCPRLVSAKRLQRRVRSRTECPTTESRMTMQLSCSFAKRCKTRIAVRNFRAETRGYYGYPNRGLRDPSDCSQESTLCKAPEKPRQIGSIRKLSFSSNKLRLFGAVEKTRTSTGFRPQRPQRCASTSSATTAKSSGPENPAPGVGAGP